MQSRKTAGIPRLRTFDRNNDIFKTLNTPESSATVTLKIGPEGLTLYKLASPRDLAFRFKLPRRHFANYKCFYTTETTLNISHLSKIFEQFMDSFSLNLREGRLTLLEQKDDFRSLRYSFALPLSD